EGERRSEGNARPAMTPEAKERTRSALAPRSSPRGPRTPHPRSSHHGPDCASRERRRRTRDAAPPARRDPVARFRHRRGVRRSLEIVDFSVLASRKGQCQSLAANLLDLGTGIREREVLALLPERQEVGIVRAAGLAGLAGRAGGHALVPV